MLGKFVGCNFSAEIDVYYKVIVGVIVGDAMMVFHDVVVPCN